MNRSISATLCWRNQFKKQNFANMYIDAADDGRPQHSNVSKKEKKIATILSHGVPHSYVHTVTFRTALDFRYFNKILEIILLFFEIPN